MSDEPIVRVQECVCVVHNSPVGALFLASCVVASMLFGVSEPIEFIYFQF